MKINFFIDPTYLRYIHDGLLNGSVQKENTSSIPEGLIGIYEEVFSDSMSLSNRTELLNFFHAWAIVKKEVTVSFVAQLLHWPDSEVEVLLSNFSSLFNSPISGKYQLYHERFRAFILSKTPQAEFTKYNNRLIHLLKQSLHKKFGDEMEYYALEYLSAHLFVESMISGQGDDLLKLAYDNRFWNRQIEISKGFDWSKRSLDNAMQWASKYNEEQIIECALNKVDLYHMEQNDAPRILELVAQNEIETALQRIESFGGNDKEGLQRKFILYMLCLMELTLLDSKDKSFRRDATEKILKHLDDNLPVDHSILDWNDFFSSYLMFLMSCEWEKIGLEYFAITIRTEEWDLESYSLGNLKPDKRFEALSDKNKKAITTALERQDYFAGQVFDMANVKKIIVDISNPIEKFSSLSFISHLLDRIGAKDKAQELLLNLVHLADSISTEWEKYMVFAHLSSELIQQGKVTEAIDLVFKSYQGALQIKDEWQKGSVILEISPLLVKLGKVSEALKCADAISQELFGKSMIISQIIEELVIKNNMYESGRILLESLETKKGMSGEWSIYNAITPISFEFIRRGKINEALICTKFLHNDYMIALALKEIAILLANLGMNENSSGIMQEALQEALKNASIISERGAKNLAFAEISMAFAKQGKFEDSSKVAQEISIKQNKNLTLNEISIEMAKVGKIDDALICIKGISSSYSESNALKSISIIVANQGRNILAIEIANSIKDASQKCKTLIQISAIIFKQGNESDSEDLMLNILPLCRNLSDLQEKITSILSISSGFSKQMKIVESDEAMQEAIGYSLEILDEEDRDLALKQICHELAKQNKYEQALLYNQKISDECEKENTKILISIELAALGNIDASEKVCSQILQINDRQKCWKRIAEKEYDANGYFNSISFCNKFLNEEARFYLRQNIIHLLDTSTISPQVVLYEIKTLSKDLPSLEHILQLYAINQLFFGELHQQKLMRYNSLLNIQWAINIKNSISN